MFFLNLTDTSQSVVLKIMSNFSVVHFRVRKKLHNSRLSNICLHWRLFRKRKKYQKKHKQKRCEWIVLTSFAGFLSGQQSPDSVRKKENRYDHQHLKHLQAVPQKLSPTCYKTTAGSNMTLNMNTCTLVYSYTPDLASLAEKDFNWLDFIDWKNTIISVTVNCRQKYINTVCRCLTLLTVLSQHSMT